LDGPQDVNLGFALTIWDQLFHRAVFPTPETIRTDTGLPGRPLVVEQAAERPRHISVFAAQLVAPFRPMHDRTDLPSIRDGSVGDPSIGNPSIQEGTRRPGGGSDRSSDRVSQADLAGPGTAEESVVA
jgi:hypothetical protein